MKSRFSLRMGLAALAVVLGLTFSGPTVWGRDVIDCMDDCLEELADCTNRTGGSQRCEDAYDNCIEVCIIIWPS